MDGESEGAPFELRELVEDRPEVRDVRVGDGAARVGRVLLEHLDVDFGAAANFQLELLQPSSQQHKNTLREQQANTRSQAANLPGEQREESRGDDASQAAADGLHLRVALVQAELLDELDVFGAVGPRQLDVAAVVLELDDRLVAARVGERLRAVDIVKRLFSHALFVRSRNAQIKLGQVR